MMKIGLALVGLGFVAKAVVYCESLWNGNLSSAVSPIAYTMIVVGGILIGYQMAKNRAAESEENTKHRISGMYTS